MPLETAGGVGRDLISGLESPDEGRYTALRGLLLNISGSKLVEPFVLSTDFLRRGNSELFETDSCLEILSLPLDRSLRRSIEPLLRSMELLRRLVEILP